MCVCAVLLGGQRDHSQHARRGAAGGGEEVQGCIAVRGGSAVALCQGRAACDAATCGAGGIKGVSIVGCSEGVASKGVASGR